MTSESETIKNKYLDLIHSSLYYFPPIKSKLEAPKERGVYVIYDTNSTVVHVGSTPRAKNGIKQRLTNHLNGSSSFKYHYLNGNGGLLRNGFSFRFLIIDNPRERALLESYAIGKLCPKHIGSGI